MLGAALSLLVGDLVPKVRVLPFVHELSMTPGVRRAESVDGKERFSFVAPLRISDGGTSLGPCYRVRGRTFLFDLIYLVSNLKVGCVLEVLGE